MLSVGLASLTWLFRIHINDHSMTECERPPLAGFVPRVNFAPDEGRWLAMTGAIETEAKQQNLFETETTRSLLDQLLRDSRLYTKSKDYQDLLDFVIRLRNFAPFNAMLLQVQKPGLRYAASANDWRFGRVLTEGARPLLILRPFGPVALVYDVMDTEGEDLPQEGQRHVLLRMREVVANTEDRASRSYDERDDREPKFYEKNVFVLKKDVTEAWYLDCDESPFGFEFFRKITLREVNFGEKNGGGARVFVAGRERTARAFERCEACGKVKRDGEILHSPWCPYRKDPEKEKAVRTCYLYREFTSEAIRMLLPVSAMQMDRKVESFIEALELGLRKKFQGDPGHLNTTVYDEPIEGSEARRRFLVLYDGVPGGTGYLKELMRAPRRSGRCSRTPSMRFRCASAGSIRGRTAVTSACWLIAEA